MLYFAIMCSFPDQNLGYRYNYNANQIEYFSVCAVYLFSNPLKYVFTLIMRERVGERETQDERWAVLLIRICIAGASDPDTIFYPNP